MRLAVLGAGAWGTALAATFAPRHSVTLWSRDPVLAADIARERENRRYLPGARLPDALHVTADWATAIGQTDAIIIATPVAGLRATLSALAQQTAPVIAVCKGFEANTGLLPHRVAFEAAPNVAFAVLSGPSFAREVVMGLPSAVTLAMADLAAGLQLTRSLHHDHLRIYASDDVIGVEVGGAVKNVMAIAAGIADGLRLGHNARAALLTRGLAEIARLGLALGGRTETFMGLSGMGDLVLTCTGDLSRNRQVGLQLASGKTLATILTELGHVAEGVSSAREVAKLAQQFAVDMPICQAIQRVLNDEIPAHSAVRELLAREPKAEKIG